MTSIRTAALLALLLCAVPAMPQSATFGEPFPLTNTRYGGRGGAPVLTSNGEDFFVVWATADHILVSRAGSSTPGRPVIVTNGHSSASAKHDVVWTGTRFLVAATRLAADGSPSVVGRFLDAHGAAMGEEFLIAAGGRDPQLAFNGSRFLLLYRSATHVAQLLDADGRATAAPSIIPSSNSDHYDVASNGSDFLVVSASTMFYLQTLAIGSDGTTRRSGTLFGLPYSGGAIALTATSDGFLLVYRDNHHFVAGAALDRNGNLVAQAWGDREQSSGTIAVARSGDGFVVVTSTSDAADTRVVRVDANRNVTAEVISSPGNVSHVAVAADGDQVLTAWSGADTVIYTAPDTPATSGPADQHIELMTSTGDAVLTVWRETTGLHAGVYTTLGDWTEVALPGDEAIAAATGGGQFVIIVGNGGEFAAIRFSLALDQIGAEIPITGFRPHAIAWNGTEFAVAGVQFETHVNVVYQKLVAARLSAGGALGETKTLFGIGESSYEQVSLASNGDAWLVAWKGRLLSGGCFPEDCFSLLWPLVGAARLSADLNRLDSYSTVSFNFVEQFSGVVWDGTDYVVVWKDRARWWARPIPPVGQFSMPVVLPSLQAQQTNVTDTAERVIAQTSDGVAIMWRERNQDRLTLLRGNTLTSVATFMYGDRATSPAHPVPFDGGIAYAVGIAHTAPPYYGASRIFMRIGDVALPPKPDAPQISARLVLGARAHLTWTAPPQETNGYRVEMRTSDGAWKEIEQWISADGERFLPVDVHASAGPTSFRVRAWNDAGVSAYSNEVTLFSGRRRATR